MRRAINERIARGAVGGLLAGLTVALWFLVVDSLAGRPFHTPAVLAGGLARQGVPAPAVPSVAGHPGIQFAGVPLVRRALARAVPLRRGPPAVTLPGPFGHLGAGPVV